MHWVAAFLGSRLVSAWVLTVTGATVNTCIGKATSHSCPASLTRPKRYADPELYRGLPGTAPIRQGQLEKGADHRRQRRHRHGFAAAWQAGGAQMVGIASAANTNSPNMVQPIDYHRTCPGDTRTGARWPRCSMQRYERLNYIKGDCPAAKRRQDSELRRTSRVFYFRILAP
jgi:hypothetical protein